jgi:AraC-like DNA-binding protein
VIEEAASAVERRVRERDRGANVLKLVLQTRGNAALNHCGRRVQLGQGDLVLVDGARAMRLELEPGYRQVMFELPREVLQRRYATLLPLAGIRLQREHAPHALLFRSLETIATELEHLPPEQGARLLDPVIGLVGALASEVPLEDSRAERTFARACADLEAHLPDPDLNAVTLAQRQGISRRHLDAIFRARGLSPERLIWTRRLERARDELASAAADRHCIDIALAWGFSSQAHFSRAFRAQYGVSPSEFRAQQRSC